MRGESFTRIESLEGPPRLVVVVDTEEEFDWSRPHDRTATTVKSVAAQTRAHRIFEKFKIRPTYVIDYPVATQKDGYQPLLELYQEGLCEIGAHLHPWVNPPHEETVNARNSYPGNLPAALERAKLERLTGAIVDRFGVQPTVYKAGRYGMGPSTLQILRQLGYKVDTSVLANSDLRLEFGPDYRNFDPFPSWIGDDRSMVEVPMTVGFVGGFATFGPQIYHPVAGPRGRALHLPGIFSRLGLVERITLTPEGVPHDAHRRLTSALVTQGLKLFSFTYHSPSLAVGNTPYVRSESDLAEFLDRIERYFDYFMGELGGRATTPTEFAASLSSQPAPA